MKKLLSLCAIVLAASTFLTSCGTDAPKIGSITVDANQADSHRGVKKVKFKGQDVTIAASDMMTAQAQRAAASADDAATLNKAFNSLQAAQNKAAQLNAQVTLSEEKVADGTFVFALDINESSNLTVELYDEEGYALAGANKMDVNSGKNYKAINVKALSDGNYVMRLTDGEGRELTQNFVIEAEK